MNEAIVSADEFAFYMRQLVSKDKSLSIVSAVSGGSDSLALTYLAAEWAKGCGHRFQALSINHGLRAESAQECELVHEWLKSRGIPHETLNLDWEQFPKARLQEKARTARYQLLSDWCLANGFDYVLLAHHLDDQIETYLMRQDKGSRFEGLAGMSATIQKNSVHFLRPLLKISKSRIIQTLRAFHQEQWIEDPSNQNTHFTRVKLREKVNGFSAEEIGALQSEIVKNQNLRIQWEQTVNQCIDDYFMLHESGAIKLKKSLFQEKKQLGHAVLQRAVMTVSGFEYPPKQEMLDHLYESLAEGQFHKTAHGCAFVADNMTIWVVREQGKAKNRVSLLKERFNWDGRFEVKCEDAPDLEISFLGEKGWRQVLKQMPDVRAKALPHKLILSLPAIWKNDAVLHVPHLNFDNRSVDRRGGAVEITFTPRYPLKRGFIALHSLKSEEYPSLQTG